MSDEVYQAIASASSGFVDAPAGCGKTEAIVRTVSSFCSGCQLVLTHTHAGVDALKRRFKEHRVPTNKYHVDTIAGWSWGWVRKYPLNADYRSSTDVAEWGEVYTAMTTLLQKSYVRQGILNSYNGVIVDEYQDCTVPMHLLIVQLKELLPCRVLGDELQGIFGFRNDPIIGWSTVADEFTNDLGALETPYRWIKAENETLGQWLLNKRPDFRQNREPDYRNSPIVKRTVSYRNLGATLIRLTHEKLGRICVIGPKMRRLSAGLETTLVNQKYKVLEPNELSELKKLIITLEDGTLNEKSGAALDFFTTVYGGFPSGEKNFIEKIIKGESQRPQRTDRQALYEKHNEGTSLLLLYDLMLYFEKLDAVSCKLYESVSALKCILEKHFDLNTGLKALYADEIARRKYQSRSNVYRCVGSTLLVKGLEFDHAVILRSPNWKTSWGNYRDLYVALTRGSKSSTLIDLSN